MANRALALELERLGLDLKKNHSASTIRQAQHDRKRGKKQHEPKPEVTFEAPVVEKTIVEPEKPSVHVEESTGDVVQPIIEQEVHVEESVKSDDVAVSDEEEKSAKKKDKKKDKKKSDPSDPESAGS